MLNKDYKYNCMSFFIIQQNIYKFVELQRNAQILLTIDMFLQTLNNTVLISGNQTIRTYLILLQTKRLQNVQVLFEGEIRDKCIKLQFKPSKLIKYNLQLISKSQRCSIQLSTKLQMLSKSSKSSPYKYYLNKYGYIIIEISYFLEQFMNQVHAQFILNKTLIQLSGIIQQILIEFLPFIKLQNLWQNLTENSTQTHQENQELNQLTPYDKIKYMRLLNEVYKNHRHQFQTQNSISKNQTFFTIQHLIKTNTLIQQDTKFVEKIEKQKNQSLQKLNQIFTLLNPKNQNKRQHLNMYKMYLTQKQFEKYIKNAKKQHLQIYQLTSMNYRIVKGVQTKILLNAEKLLSDDGAHANIFFGTYTLHLSDTLFHYQLNIKEEQTEQKVVVKPLVCKRIKNSETESSLNSFKNELSFLFHCKDKRSKFIATYFLPIQKNKDDLSEIFLQYYPNNLSDFLEKKSKNGESIRLLDLLKFAQAILFALIFMTQNSALHRDLKPCNVMIDSSLKPRLIDFGSCCPIYNKTQFTVKQKRILITPGYQLRYKQTPQLIRKKYQKPQFQQHILYDIYSFGVSLEQIAQYAQRLEEIGEKQGVKVSQIFQMIISKCKQPDPIDRVTFDELLYYISILKDIIQK